MDPIFERIKTGGEIELPREIMKSLHLEIGEEVELILKDRTVLIKPRRSIVDEITGAIVLDQKTAEEIIDSKELTMSMWD